MIWGLSILFITMLGQAGQLAPSWLIDTSGEGATVPVLFAVSGLSLLAAYCYTKARSSRFPNPISLLCEQDTPENQAEASMQGQYESQ